MTANNKGFSAIEILVLIALASGLGFVLVPRIFNEDYSTRVQNVERLALITADAVNNYHAIWEATGHDARLEIDNKTILMTQNGWPETVDSAFSINGKMDAAKCISILNGLTESALKIDAYDNCKNNRNCDLLVDVSKDAMTCIYTDSSKYLSLDNVISYNIENGSVFVSAK